jgi:1-deoxy-D-xylulose-5-phosphate synthase
MVDNGYTAQIKRLGIPDKYIEHGTQDELYAECGYDVAAMVDRQARWLEKEEG